MIKGSLIVHGEVDAVVQLAQAQRLLDALQAAGAPVTLQVVTNGDHSLMPAGGPVSPTLSEIVQQIVNFFDNTLGFSMTAALRQVQGVTGLGGVGYSAITWRGMNIRRN